MWTSDRRKTRQAGESWVDWGEVTLEGTRQGPIWTVSGGSWRSMGQAATAGSRPWGPGPGAEGGTGRVPCVAGKRQGEAETLGAGEVSISSSGAESGLLLRTDGRLELNGQVMVNGQSLNGLIRQIVLAILGGG